MWPSGRCSDAVAMPEWVKSVTLNLPMDTSSMLSWTRSSAFAVLALLASSFVEAGANDDIAAMRKSSAVVCSETRGHHDGDTFTCLPAGGARAAFVVRVAGIDAPETGQSHWRAARARLRELVSSGSAVDCYKRDRFARDFCRVTSAEGLPVAEAMIGEGLAWYAEDFASEDSHAERETRRSLEQQARETGQSGSHVRAENYEPRSVQLAWPVAAGESSQQKRNASPSSESSLESEKEAVVGHGQDTAITEPNLVRQPLKTPLLFRIQIGV